MEAATLEAPAPVHTEAPAPVPPPSIADILVDHHLDHAQQKENCGRKSEQHEIPDCAGWDKRSLRQTTSQR